MELLKKESQPGLTQNIATIQLNDGFVVHYKEWVDERGKVVDCSIISKNGHEIDDPALFDEICEFVDENVEFD